MNDDDLSRFDQSAAFLGDSLPSLWRRIYLKCLEEGFKEDEALHLLRAYIHGSNGGALERPR